MNGRFIFTPLLTLSVFTGQSQVKENSFRLGLTNHSRYTTYCTILGNEKTDSVLAGQKKSIRFHPEADEASFYLRIHTADTSSLSYRVQRIRILNTKGFKNAVVTKDNQLQYELTKEESIVAKVNPQLRTKNFWKLDTIINQYADHIAGAEIIYLTLCDIDVKTDTIRKYYDLLSSSVKSSPFGNRIEGYLEARTRLAVGRTMIPIVLADTIGKTVRLENIKADYILLDFWFSRCLPCIESFESLKNLYSKTTRHKLEIVGISVDEKSETLLWKKTIAKHALPWINIHDPGSAVVRKLVIVNYPTKVLLDKNKKIVLVDTRNNADSFFQELEKLISETD